MIEIGPAQAPAPAAEDLPGDITARDLLRAASHELRRQANAMTALDSALGPVIAALTTAPGAPGGGLPSAAVSNLQCADRIRQDMEGLAALLSLLVDLPPSARIPAATVRAHATTQDQSIRLLRGQ